MNLPDPRVVLTDKEKALINAIEAEFPFTKCMLCIWHVNKNILAKARAFLRRDTLSLFGDNDPQFLPRLKEKEKAMLGLWMSVVYAGTVPDMEEAWRKFQAEYNTEMYAEVVMYIKSEWMESDTARRLLHAYTSSYLHLGNQATSRGEAAHWCLKRDLQVSTNDLLTVIRSFERTVTNQHANLQQQLADARITKPIQYLSFLFTNVLTKISRHAIGKVAAIRDAYLPPGRDKKEIKECTGATTRTLGIPCIHVIKSHVDEQRPLSIDQFHRHWHLHAPETLPPVDPRLLLLEPRVNRTRGRPAGAINRQHKSCHKLDPPSEIHLRSNMCWRKGEAVADGVEDGVVDRLLVKSAPRSPRRKVEAIMAEATMAEVDVEAEAIMAEATKGKRPCEWNSTGDVKPVQFLNNNADRIS